MNDFSCVNLFYNFVYNDQQVYERDLKADYEDFAYFKDWLKRNDIRVPSLEKINSTMFNYAKNTKNTKQIEHLLHMNLSADYQQLRETYRPKIHCIFFPGVAEEPWAPFKLTDQEIVFHQITERLTKEDLFLNDPCDEIEAVALYVSEFPGAWIFTEGQERFFPMRQKEDIAKLNQLLRDPDLFDYTPTGYTYYLHLSDLHLGSARKYQSVEALYESLNRLYPHLKSDHQLKVLITGDLMNTPSERNMYQANDFMSVIKKHYHANVSFVLGNHDMITAGLSMSTRNKSKAIAYLLGEKIKVFEDDHVILLKIDSNMSGNFARGHIGQRQLAEIEYELSAIDHLEDYTLIAMLHHHVYPVQKSDFLKRKWNEKYLIGKLMDTSKALTDAKKFIEWLNEHHIRYVLHGHKHIPFFMKRKGTYIISAGSATGSLPGNVKESESKYLSYNVLKYDYIHKRFVSCSIFYRDKKFAQRLKVETYLFDGEENDG